MAYFSGGNLLKKALAKISGKSKGSVNVGFLAGATYPETGQSVAQVAFWDEFGTTTSPPRPFFRPMIARESSGWGVRIASGLKYYNYDAQKLMAAMGSHIRDELQASIIAVDGPALSPITLILRKRFWTNPWDIRGADVGDAARAAAAGEEGASGTQAKPLIWTGTMLNAADYEVKPK